MNVESWFEPSREMQEKVKKVRLNLWHVFLQISAILFFGNVEKNEQTTAFI